MDRQLISNVGMEAIVANIPSTVTGLNDRGIFETTGMHDSWA